jgi:hypothetical protein
MTIEQVRRHAQVAERTHALAAECDAILQKAVAAYLDGLHGSGRALAKELGISAAYLCDIKLGRRKISVEFLAKLTAMAKPTSDARPTGPRRRK